MTTINELLDRYIPNELPKLARRTQIDYKVPDKPKPPKTRYLETTDPAEQVPLDQCVLESPIGDWRDGKFYATGYSLEQYRGKPYKVKA